MAFYNCFLESAPCIRQEQHQHREDLQTAGQHVEDHHQLCRVRKAAKVHHGAYLRKARADVVQSSCNGCEVRHHIKAIQTDEQEGYLEDEEIRRQKCEHFGLVYVFRKGEKEEIKRKKEAERITLKLPF